MQVDISQLIRVGQVDSVNAETCSCRVSFDDLRDGDGKPFKSYDLQILQRRTVDCQTFNLPNVGEHVLCLFLPNGIQEGFVVNSFYTAENLPKDGKKGIYRHTYEDDTIIEYDLNEHKARVYTKYKVEVECKEAKVKAETIDVEAKKMKITSEIEIVGDVKITGSINASGNIIDGGSNTNHHSH